MTPPPVKNACIFCGKSPPEVKISKEHVMRKSLRKHMPTQHGRHFVTQRHLDETTGLFVNRQFSVEDPFSLVVNCVCKICNEGWLEARVEVPAERALKSMMQGIPFLLTTEISKAVATWAAKTAAVRAYVDKPPRCIPPEHYRHLMQALEPPPGTHVWLAHTLSDQARDGRHLRWQTATVTCHLTTLHYGHMALFIAGVSDPAATQNLLSFTINRLDSSAAIRLWPNPHSARWPNTAIADTDVLMLSEPSYPAVPGVWINREAMLTK